MNTHFYPRTPAIPHFDCLMITGMLILAAGGIMFGSASFAGDLDTRWAGFTLGASVMVSAMAFFLQHKAEAKKIVLGRFAGALIGGIFGSRLSWHLSDWVKEISTDPIMIGGIGAFFAFGGYMLAASFVDWWERRATSIVERSMKWSEDRYLPPMPPEDPPTDKITHASTRRKSQ